MKAIFLFDIRGYTKRFTAYLGMACFLGMGIFAGNRFNLSAGEGINFNGAYTIGFMLGMLSLSTILIATVFGQKLLFMEWDTRFDLILFSTPVGKGKFASGHFLSLLILTVFSFLLVTIGFAIGQQIRAGFSIHLLYYLYPFILFGCINSLFVCSFLSCIAWRTRSKLMMALGGMLLYVLYMVTLLFSNSPLMAQASPQSLATQQVSAMVDPFGLSAYFYDSRGLSVSQRNTVLLLPSGYFLVNRLIITAVSFVCLWLGYTGLSGTGRKAGSRSSAAAEKSFPLRQEPDFTIATRYNLRTKWQSIWSFVKINIGHTYKNIPFIASVVILLFYTGMEMYAAIEKGIRLPQQYASSGLMAVTISESFYFMGMLLMVYFAHDLFWKSSNVKFSAIENTTAHVSFRQWGHWFSCVLLLLCYTVLMIMLGLSFQWAYHYPVIDWKAYGGVVIFNTGPLILLTGMLLFINQLAPRNYIALSICILTTLAIASPLSKKIISLPLFRFLSGFNGVYSDFNGYGAYLPSFVERLIFGASVVGMLWLIYSVIKNRRLKVASLIGMLALGGGGVFSGIAFMYGYAGKDRELKPEAAARYEKLYRKYQDIPQPVVTAVTSRISLYPGKRSYTIAGSYIIKNLTTAVIHNILINFDERLHMLHAAYVSKGEEIPINQAVTALLLNHGLQPNDSAAIHFEISYSWAPVNGHQPFNAIIENGSFMRISRYYPQIGYQPQKEITDSLQRKKWGLGEATKVTTLTAPKSSTLDFIYSDMLISTDSGQTAIGTGELIAQWQQGNRSYFHYKTNEPVPFRFAVASAVYSMRRIVYKGIEISVYYHPKHDENVAHLISCAKNTLDYCQENFGAYPFRSLAFSEVSSFTSGFAATAYPANIFMTENMLFHANIKADRQQDVINELAGHELSHLWWGNNQIAPDDREGAAMLTETLAMYTEMMLYKKIYGRQKMLERVQVHQQIYDMEKGLSENRPLYKVQENDTHISYSKGALVMVKLSELIGENKVNEALRNFLLKNKYPRPRPVSIDLITELLKVSEEKYHHEIKKMFMEI